MNNKTTKLVLSAMFTALTCIATMVIQIPTIGTNGYVNIGDTLVLVSAWFLGAPYGILAAGLGSGLADLLSGYAVYVPGTIIIKALMALVAYGIFFMLKTTKIPKVIALFFSSVPAEIIMVLGYFLFESTILGYGMAAAASIPSNAVQGVTCLVLGCLVMTLLPKSLMLKDSKINQ